MHPYLQQLEAAERIRDMRSAADAGRLARKARRARRRDHGEGTLRLAIPRPRQAAEPVTRRAA
jgi:hypothetical protein